MSYYDSHISYLNSFLIPIRAQIEAEGGPEALRQAAIPLYDAAHVTDAGLLGFGIHEYQGMTGSPFHAAQQLIRKAISFPQNLTDADKAILAREGIPIGPSGATLPNPVPPAPPGVEPEPPTEPSPPDPPPTDVSQPCPEGSYRVLFGEHAGECWPIGPGNPTPPAPVVDETVVEFAGGVSLRLYVNDPRLPNVGIGKVVRLTAETVAFHYGNASNLEVFAKVLDGRGFNNHWWVFSCGLTDVGVKLVAIKGSEKKEYVGVSGTSFPTSLDTSAFTA